MNTNFPIAQYQQDVQEIVARPLVENCILFVGSSTFTIWNQEKLERDMAPLAVKNVAFGGSTAYEVLHYYDQVVKGQKARAVVWYEGDNDLCGSFTPEETFAFSVAVFDKIRMEYGPIPLILISTKQSPLRFGFAENYAAYNEKLKLYAAMRDYVQYVDINEAFVCQDGAPRVELFRDDRIHFCDKGYEALTAVLKPILTAL